MTHSLIRYACLALLVPLLLVGAPLGAPTPAAAQNYNANCGKITDDVHNAEVEMAQNNPILNLFIKAGNKACELHEMVKNIFKNKGTTDPDKIEVGDVVEAAKPQSPSDTPGKPEGVSERTWKEILAEREYKKRNPNWEAEAKLTHAQLTNAANDTRPEDLPCHENNTCTVEDDTKPGKGFAIFVSNDPKPDAPIPTKVSEVNGDGTLVTPGEIDRGTFDKGELEGVGEEVTDDGTWRGGTYKDGKIEGEGFETGERDGKDYLVTGNFHGGRPDGTALMTYSDGTSQYVTYKGGMGVAWGPLALPGETPGRIKSPEELAEADFDAKMKATSSPGALYALADEMAEKGDDAKARAAYRELLRRYPNSALAAKAADRLGSGSGTATASTGGAGRGTGASGSNTSNGSSRNSDAAFTTNASYQTSIPNPVMPASFYQLFSGRNLSFAECDQSANDPRGMAIMNDLKERQDGSSFQRLRAVIVSTEVSMVFLRQCEQLPNVRLQLDAWTSARAQAITTCQQTASSPEACLKPYDWKP